MSASLRTSFIPHYGKIILIPTFDQSYLSWTGVPYTWPGEFRSGLQLLDWSTRGCNKINIKKIRKATFHSQIRNESISLGTGCNPKISLAYHDRQPLPAASRGRRKAGGTLRCILYTYFRTTLTNT